ncbi:MAG: TrkA family potassium uptake protein [Desulfuromonadaceae bacterium]|nr:TrkA family potassium uptake protein [Desulfuromonadaceae bacterium]
MKKHSRFAVIGLGNFGFHVTQALYETGHEVIAIDINQDKVQRIQDHASYAILGDAGNKEFLIGQGLGDMTAVVVSTGERSHLSTLITLYLKEMAVPRILVKALNEDHGRILMKVGASDVIFPEKDMAKKIARSLSTPNILEYIPLAGEYTITEADPPKHYLGKTLADLELRRKHHVTVLGIKDVLTGSFSLAPSPSYIIKDSDLLIFLGKADDIDKSLEDR